MFLWAVWQTEFYPKPILKKTACVFLAGLKVKTDKEKALVLWFNEVDQGDVALVGGKNAALGELILALKTKGIRVPNGFCVTASAYRYFLEKTGLTEEIRRERIGLDRQNISGLAKTGKKIRDAIMQTSLPSELAEEIIQAYRELSRQYQKNADVAVRSSATAEDLPSASFAGQQETYLNVSGEHEVLFAVQKCFASLFTDRAIAYRIDKGFEHSKVFLSVGIQKMVRSDSAASGVMFTVDTETGFKDAVVINSSYGLGESVVQGLVNPDQFVLFKPLLRIGKKPLIGQKKGDKKTKVVYGNGGKQTKTVGVPEHDQNRFSISNEIVFELAKAGILIEDHFSKKAGHWQPMDIEWALDGQTGELFIVQARPETVQSQKNRAVLENWFLQKPAKTKALCQGESVGDKAGTGKARVIRNVHHIGEFKSGEVLVTDTTDPDWEPIMKMASAIVTNSGGRTSHAAIVARELGIPCVVGTQNATQKIKSGQTVTVSCCEGETGFVYAGKLKISVRQTRLNDIPSTKTQIMVNLGNPDEAFEVSQWPSDGVGLCREEFVIASQIGIHPLALIHFDKIKDASVKQKIRELTAGFSDKKDFFVTRLAQGIGMIAAAFYPKPVIVRFSDFKTNEYAQLSGGAEFEPQEENPMLGWRGASRYYSDAFRPAFSLECHAIKKVREEMGLTNVKVMVPFCRTVEEGKKVVLEMKKNGLMPKHGGLEVFVMCEIPANVVLANEFAKVFDGFSIGSNDLTQLALGLDRDSALVSELYDEEDPAVQQLVADAVMRVQRRRKKIGICGQAPSDKPKFVRFLVECGIDSISVNPDALLKTRLLVAQIERAQKKEKN